MRKRFIPKNAKTILIFSCIFFLALILPTIIAIWVSPKKADASWYSNGWNKRKKITIDHTKVSGTADLSSFPVLVSITDSNLKNYAQSSGNDILFTSQDGTTKLNHEIEKYTSSTGTLVAWVQVPTLYYATDTIIYMYYGNSSASSQQSIAATWSSSFAEVYHFAQTPVTNTNTQLNSANNTIEGQTAQTWSAGDLTSGQIGDTLTFSGANGIATTDRHSGNNITVSGWVNLTSNSDSWITLAQRTNSSNDFYDWQFYVRASDADTSNSTVVRLDFDSGKDGDSNEHADGTTILSTGTWYYVAAAYNGSTVAYYLNGVQQGTTSSCGSCTIPDSNNQVTIAGNTVWGELLTGKIDEFRVSTTGRSSDWLKTEYNNQNAPSTFLTTSSQETPPPNSTTAESPVLYWGLDEGAGSTANDKSGNNLSGTITNAVWQTEDLCVVGKCLFFDGSGDYVSLASTTNLDFAASDSFSITGWFRHKPSTSGTDVLIARHNNTAGGFKMYMESDGDITCALDRDSSFTPEDFATSTAATYDDNQWHHVACVKSTTSSLTLYIDGNQVAQDSSIASTGSYANTNSFYLGIDGNGSSNGFEGFLDDFKIYRSALSASQLKADMQSSGSPRGAAASFGQPSTEFLNSGLVGYWPLDELSANTCTGGTNDSCDKSGNSNNGAWTGNTTTTSGRFGSGNIFDGSGDYTTISDNNSLDLTTNLTMSAWIYVTDPNADIDKYIFSHASHLTSDGYALAINWDDTANLFGIKMRVYNTTLSTDEFETITSNSYSGSTWYHVAATYDSGIVRLYVNGVLVKEDKTFPTTIDAPGTAATIGDFNSEEFGTSSFKGSIDEMRVYNRTLTPYEVKQLYNWAPGPVGYWKFDENTGNTIRNVSGMNSDSVSFDNSQTWSTGKYGSSLRWLASQGTSGNLEMASGDSYISSTSRSFTISTYLKVRSAANLSYWFSQGIMGRLTVTNNNGCTDLTGIETEARSATALYLYVAARYQSTGSSCNQATTIGYGSQSINFNQWYYATMTFDGDTKLISFYVDGKLVGTSTWGGTGDWTIAGSELYLGGTSVSSDSMDFELDEMKAYNYVRTPSQIIEDMNGGHPAGGSPIGSQLIYTKLDEQTGTTANNSGNGSTSYNGTLSGTTWIDATRCKSNGCLSFGNTASSVSFGDVSFVDSATALSASLWINPQAVATNKMILSKANTATQRVFSVKTDDSTSTEIKVMIASSASDTSNYCITSGFGLSTNTWQYLAVWYDGTQAATDRVKVYKNGRQVTCTVTGTIPTSLTSGTSSNLKLGRGDDTTPTSLIAFFDEFKLYTGSLTPDQILIDYNQGAAVNFNTGGTLEASLSAQTNDSPPVGYWNFNEGSGTTAKDISGYGFNTTLTNGPQWKPGKYGSGLAINGSSTQYALYDDTRTLALDVASSFTVSAWAYFNTLAVDNQEIVIKSSDNGTNMNWYIQTGHTADSARDGIDCGFWNGSGGNLASGNPHFVTGKWYNITCVFNDTANTVTLYVNGVQSAQQTSVTGTPPTGNGDLFIGSYSNNGSWGGSSLNGIVDEVKFYNYVRTPSQIAYDYNRGQPTSWWKFDECQGSTIYDSSGNDNHGTWSGTGSGSQTSVGTCTTSSTAWGNGATGKYNSSLNFDGTDDYVEKTSAVGLPLGASPRTISAWVKTDTTNAYEYIVSYGTRTTPNWFGLAIENTGKIYIDTWGNDTPGTAVTSINNNQWHHVVAAYDGSTSVSFYLDGKFLETDSISSPANTTGTTIRIGNSSENLYYFKGQIDDLKIFNYALSAAQVFSLYNAGTSVMFGPSQGSP